MAITGGWLHVERNTGNAMAIRLASDPPWLLSYKEKPLFDEDLPGDQHAGASINTITRTIVCLKLMFNAKADVEEFMAKIKTLNLAGTFTVEIQVETGALPGSLLKLDGTNTGLEMRCFDYKNLQILSLGGGTLYMIPTAIFKQMG